MLKVDHAAKVYSVLKPSKPFHFKSPNCNAVLSQQDNNDNDDNNNASYKATFLLYPVIQVMKHAHLDKIKFHSDRIMIY